MLKVVIAGCGHISVKKHIPAFLKLRNKVIVIAVCDLNDEIANKVGHKFGIKKVYTNFSEMLLREKPDIVDICTPPLTHTKLAIEALEKGCHVIIEKPMALSVPDCDAIIEAASRNKKKLGVIHNQLFNPAFTKAKELVSKGIIGKFLGINIFLSTPTDYMTSIKEHWAHRLPGGVFGETGPHSVYLASAFLNNIYDVDIRTKKLMPECSWSNFEDFRFVLIAENGIGSITHVYGSNQWAADVDIIGTKGILKLDLQSKSVIKFNRTQLKAIPLGLSNLNMVLQTLSMLASNALKYILNIRIDPHAIGIQEFVDSVLKDKQFLITLEECKNVVSIMELIVHKLDKISKELVVSS